MKASILVLLIIFVLALTLRLLGTNPGYPPIHPDEPKIADSAIRIAFYGDFKPVAYYYGQLLPLLYAGVHIVFFTPLFFALVLPINLISSLQRGHTGTFGCFLQGADDVKHCILTRSQDFFYYLARYETAIVGSLSVLLVYLLGKKLFGKEVGLIAAFLTAINYRHVLSSTLSLADAPAATFALLSVLLSLALLTNRSVKTYVLAGMGLALVLSVKYFFYTIPLFFLCHLISVWKISGKTMSQKMKRVFFSPKFVLSLLITFALFLIINPFLFLDWKEASSQLGLNFQFYRINSDSANLTFNLKSLFPIYYLFKYGIGEALSVLILLGFFYSTFRYPKSTLLLSSVILPFLYFFLVISGANFVRNYTAIVPFLLLFPALLLANFVHYLKIGSLTLPVLLVIVFLIGFPSLKNSFILSSSLSKPQNQELLLNFIVDNIPNDAILAHTWGAPVPSYKPAKTINWSPWPSGFMSLEELREANVDWVAVSSEATTFANTALWTSHNEIVQPAFTEGKFLETIFQNNYAGLVVAEIGNYRVKEFLKPFWQSTDVSFFVAKLPPLSNMKKQRLTAFNFEGNAQKNIWEELSFLKEKRYHSTITDGEGINKSKALGLSQIVSCEAPVYATPLLAMISSSAFAVVSDKWYSLSGLGRREALPKYSEFKNGFLRLDFYSGDNKLLKTYVTKQLAAQENWQVLNAAGLSPKDASYGKVAIQVDYCNDGERYYFDELEVFVSEQNTIQPQDYPFLDVPLPKNFTWLPPL